MDKAVKVHRPPSGRTNLASCLVASIFLIFLVIVTLIVFFTVLKPKHPKLTVNSIQLPTFSVANSTVNFTFSQYVTVNNPNKGVFSHYDSILQLLYAGSQVGFLFVPAGKINAGQTRYMAATFFVKSFPLSSSVPQPQNEVPAITNGLIGVRVGSTMEIESRIMMEGRVRMLHFFNHHVEANSACRVSVAVNDGSVLGFRC